MTGRWRAMQCDDLGQVVALADLIHAAYPEDAAVFAEKLTLYPDGCFVHADAAGGVRGYGLAHPWRRGSPPALNTRLRQLPDNPDSLFIHDIALAEELRGRGAAAALLPRLFDAGRRLGLADCALVAVSGSAPFWRRMGFAVSPNPAVQAYVRAHYAPDALHMTRPIGQTHSP